MGMWVNRKAVRAMEGDPISLYIDRQRKDNDENTQT